MVIFLYILLIASVLGLLYSIFTLYICKGAGGSKLYCKIYERKMWKAWEKVVQNFDGIKFIGHDFFEDDPKLNNYEFELPIDDFVCRIKYWEKENVVSVHGIKHFGIENDCLSNFDKYHSNLVKEMLCEKFDFMREVADGKTTQTGVV